VGSSCTIDATSKTTLEDIKQALSDKGQAPSVDYNILAKGVQMDEGRTLEDYGVDPSKENAAVYVSIRLRGGSRSRKNSRQHKNSRKHKNSRRNNRTRRH
jgi:hypothetical protein